MPLDTNPPQIRFEGANTEGAQKAYSSAEVWLSELQARLRLVQQYIAERRRNREAVPEELWVLVDHDVPALLEYMRKLL